MNLFLLLISNHTYSSPSNLYDKAEEVRDDLVTALQSINNTRFYIKSELPYCSKTEMSVLEKVQMKHL